MSMSKSQMLATLIQQIESEKDVLIEKLVEAGYTVNQGQDSDIFINLGEDSRNVILVDCGEEGYDEKVRLISEIASIKRLEFDIETVD